MWKMTKRFCCLVVGSSVHGGRKSESGNVTESGCPGRGSMSHSGSRRKKGPDGGRAVEVGGDFRTGLRVAPRRLRRRNSIHRSRRDRGKLAGARSGGRHGRSKNPGHGPGHRRRSFLDDRGWSRGGRTCRRHVLGF